MWDTSPVQAWGMDGAQHAIQHTKPHRGFKPMSDLAPAHSSPRALCLAQCTDTAYNLVSMNSTVMCASLYEIWDHILLRTVPSIHGSRHGLEE